MKIPAKAIPDINVYVDSDWAGCPTTRRSTTGFLITLLGTTINYGSRTQATIALSSAEAELYAINTGATESLYIRNILQEALNAKKVNIRIHTDSSSGKSMATRIGSSKKAKHIGPQHHPTPFHPTTGAARSCEGYQDQHSEKTPRTSSPSTWPPRRS